MDWINNIKLSNPFSILIVCIITIWLLIKGHNLQNFLKIEIVFMNEKEKILREAYIYVLLLAALGVVNIVVVKNLTSYLYGIFIILSFIVAIIAFVKRNDEKNIKFFLLLIVVLGIVYSIIVKDVINIYSGVIIVTTGEIGLIKLLIPREDINNKTDFYIQQNDERWYVYESINDTYILCGNESDKRKSSRIKLIKYDSNLELIKQSNDINKAQEHIDNEQKREYIVTVNVVGSER